MNEIQTIQRIHDRYDAERDVIPGAPAVTWADEQLAQAIDILLDRIFALQTRVKWLEDGQK